MRLVVAHNPAQAKEQMQLRRERINQLQVKADQWAGKLDGQDAGEVRTPMATQIPPSVATSNSPT
jgi:hypothetical protein